MRMHTYGLFLLRDLDLIHMSWELRKSDCTTIEIPNNFWIIEAYEIFIEKKQVFRISQNAFSYILFYRSNQKKELKIISVNDKKVEIAFSEKGFLTILKCRPNYGFYVKQSEFFTELKLSKTLYQAQKNLEKINQKIQMEWMDIVIEYFLHTGGKSTIEQLRKRYQVSKLFINRQFYTTLGLGFCEYQELFGNRNSNNLFE